MALPEFVALMAIMVSITALATDIMLPALDLTGSEPGVAGPKDTQLVVTTLFFGFAFGQVLAGWEIHVIGAPSVRPCRWYLCMNRALRVMCK